MKYCKYHPLEPSTHYCKHCDIAICDTCTDLGEHNQVNRCFHCNNEVESLGAVNYATPFWRNLELSFRYPLSSSPLATILIVSVLSTVLIYAIGFSIFTLIGQVILAGMLIKYGFSCLQHTANGDLDAPDVTEAFEGGVALLFALMFMAFLSYKILERVYVVLGPSATAAVGIIMLISIPAVIITYAIRDSFIEALNPLNSFQLITTIGLPYGLLLVFIIIMIASVSFINQIIGQNFSFVSLALNSVVANYYLIVVFQIMGYMIFQYQGRLGFTARENQLEVEMAQTENKKIAAQIDMNLKEGEFERVIDLFNLALEKYPTDREFNQNFFNFLIRTNNTETLGRYGTHYLLFILNSSQKDKIAIIYKQILQVIPNFVPDNPLLRFNLAKACLKSGDPKSTINLVNGMHKIYPDFSELVDAYELMAEALEDLPNMKTQADKCRKLALKIKRARPEREKPKPANLNPVSVNNRPTETEEKSKDLPPIEFK